MAIPTKCLTAMIASIPPTIAEIKSANAADGNAEKFTNRVMRVTARPRIQAISERFRSGVPHTEVRQRTDFDRLLFLANVPAYGKNPTGTVVPATGTFSTNDSSRPKKGRLIAMTSRPPNWGGQLDAHPRPAWVKVGQCRAESLFKKQQQ